MTAETMTDAEAQAVVDMWLRDDTIMGEWFTGPEEEWYARDCETKVGPLAGPPISLRLHRVRRPGPAMYVGEARRSGIPIRSNGPGECLQILPVDPDTWRAHGWATPAEGREALEAVLRNEHDPETIRLPNIDRWERV